ncbi:translation initiation factor IF-1A [Candidatus Pacearchaeota archaeon CG10_big_fil_rev_8_21_14_0_10_31_9]|nr:MAG: translation initiation factor IF-1A [Candidatus Pacearchaeota archaeon CG1_02_32_21]PIN95045.1 MAG: translation initiation factor IF-1A [Candidatus Pacearchaeota archaeon CG10_big_fil_rev_8_21_14_0_10_31_9]PIZ82464.1 MAG: translation initiation factor IF-1A [Candidatus Pacearchaeota archaeon CG_4_10_14_0_2_um_filter_05_32_18]
MKKHNKVILSEQPEQITRVRLPRGKEILGIIDQRVGGGRMLIHCADGKIRNCRVPGRLKRELWIREGNVVIIEPWEFDNDKGDILFKYNPAQTEFLRRNGHLSLLEGGQ